jgi:hypothetical protein
MNTNLSHFYMTIEAVLMSLGYKASFFVGRSFGSEIM